MELPDPAAIATEGPKSHVEYAEANVIAQPENCPPGL
jgi:hypothetical protein